MSIKTFFFPKWKIIERKHVTFTQEFTWTGLNTTEDVELIIEENQDGKRRAFVVRFDNRKKVNLEYAEGFLKGEKEKKSCSCGCELEKSEGSNNGLF